jgi:hypothetical protein
MIALCAFSTAEMIIYKPTVVGICGRREYLDLKLTKHILFCLFFDFMSLLQSYKMPNFFEKNLTFVNIPWNWL